MSFNLTIKSDDAIKYLNGLIINPNLIHFYIFKPVYLSENLLKNQGISGVNDLLMDSSLNLSYDGILTFPTTDTIGPQLTNTLTLNTSFSIGGWININNFSTSQFLFYSSTTPSPSVDRFGISISTSGQLNVVVFVGTNPSSRTFQFILTNNWYHFCFVLDNTNWIMYINGSPQTSPTVVAIPSIERNYTYIGKGNTGSNLNGSMTNFFIYNNVLTTAEITDIYSKGYIPNQQSNFFNTIPIQYYTYKPYSNNQLNYYYDFNAKPINPYGNNKYKITSSFISYGTSNITTLNNNMLYYIIKGLGSVKIYPNNNYYKNIVFKLDSQKWIDESPELTSIIDSLKDTGLITVEIRQISNNELSTDNATWGAQVSDYMINILFEPIE